MKKTISELLAIWTARCKNGVLLDIASPDGKIATWAAEHDCPSAYYHLDLVACRSVTNRKVDVHFAAELPSGSFQTVTMDGTVLEPQVACELALDAARILADGGEFLSVPPKQWQSEKWISHLSRAFANVQVISESAENPVVACHAPTVVCEVKDMSLTLTQQLDGRAYQFHSAPGIFSARAIDQGTLAMLEEIAKMTPQHKVLDLGCGIGVVGIHLASMWKSDVVAVDTNARALRSTAINAKLNGVAEHIHVVPSDGFSDIEHSEFDIVATNPPYHTDYSVGKRFIHGAYQNLRVGGCLWVVVKRPDWYINRIRSVFHGCSVLQKNGYFILTAIKKPKSEVSSEKQKPPSRKHLKRMEEAEKRNKGRKRPR